MRHHSSITTAFWALATAAAFCALPSCTREDSREIVLDKLTLETSDLTFPPTGGEGVITVRGALSAVEATSAQDWCAESVTDSVVSLTIMPYDGIENRYSTVSISAGGKSSNVTVVQRGVIFDIVARDRYILRDDADSLSLPVSANYSPLGLECGAGWLSARHEDGAIVVNVEANASGHMREAYLTYSLGTIRDSILFTQCEAADLAGEYYLCYNASSSLVVGVNLDVTVRDSTVTATLTGLEGLKFTGTYVQDSLKIKLANCQYMGETSQGGTSKYAYWCLMESSSMTASVSQDIYSEMYVSCDSVSGKIRWTLVDNGQWESHKGDGYCVISFSSSTDGKPGGVRKYPYIFPGAWVETRPE